MTALRRVSGQPTWLLSRANARAQRLLHDAFERAGVRGYHFRLLAALEEFGPASQADLGRRTGIDRSDVVATVRDLVEAGLVTRRQDDADRRRNVIAITRKGAATLEWLDTALAAVQEEMLEPLSVRERTAFLGSLAKLA